VPPLPALAPVIPPVIVPTAQVKELAVLAVKLMLGLVLLQIDVVGEVVICGVGLTVTVITKGAPTQLPVTDVGVTMYSTFPAVLLLGFASV